MSEAAGHFYQRILHPKAQGPSRLHIAEHNPGDQRMFRTLFRGSHGALDARCVTWMLFSSYCTLSWRLLDEHGPHKPVLVAVCAVNAKPVRCVGYHEACERCQAHMLLEYERLDGFALRAPGVNLRLEMGADVYHPTVCAELHGSDPQHSKICNMRPPSFFLKLLFQAILSLLVVCFR
jgi:hypothetical protein